MMKGGGVLFTGRVMLTTPPPHLVSINTRCKVTPSVVLLWRFQYFQLLRHSQIKKLKKNPFLRIVIYFVSMVVRFDMLNTNFAHTFFYSWTWCGGGCSQSGGEGIKSGIYICRVYARSQRADKHLVKTLEMHKLHATMARAIYPLEANNSNKVNNKNFTTYA